MPPAALALVLFFIAASVVVGIVAVWITGPRRPLAVILPVLAAFGALFVVGHRSGLAVGPTVQLFGFEVNLLFDLLVAVVAALIAAKAQCFTVSWWGHRRAAA